VSAYLLRRLATSVLSLYLSCVSLLLAILVAVPLGI
jgi:ABC-type proline/glycine betaine transport system permease subunit